MDIYTELADEKESEGDIESALEYHQKCLHSCKNSGSAEKEAQTANRIGNVIKDSSFSENDLKEASKEILNYSIILICVLIFTYKTI